MKTLLILRHAKAEADSSSGSDFDRRLTARGHRDSAAVGRALRDSGRPVDAILASPALRAAETAANVAQGAGLACARLADRRLYNASPGRLLQVVREAEDAVETLLLVGHNPGLQQMIVDLAQDDPAGLRPRIAAGFPTAALAELRLSIDQWRDAGPGCGRITALIQPGDLE
jgi:phosphohistidine phosphatase